MRKYLRWIYLVVALAAIAGVLFLGCNPLVKAAPGASDVPEVSQEKRAQAALETLYILKNFYLYDADENVLLDAYKKEQSIEDMIKALDDPLARHMDESEFRTFMDDMKGSFDGIGIVVGIRDGELTIVAPIKDTPGERAGLMPLDKIKHIDGRSTQDMALEYAVSLMKGKKGTTVVLGIERNENETTNTLVGRLSSFAAIAIPLAADNPWPKDPVDISTPGTCLILGWPCNLLPNFLRVVSSSLPMKPASARVAYRAGAAWPFDITNLSLSGHVGFFESILISLK
jgi:hypothetical protein